MNDMEITRIERRKKLCWKFILDHSSWCDLEDLQEIIIDMMVRSHEIDLFKKSFSFSCQKIHYENESSSNLGMQENEC